MPFADTRVLRSRSERRATTMIDKIIMLLLTIAIVAIALKMLIS